MSGGYLGELLVDVLGSLLKVFEVSLDETLLLRLLKQFDSLVNHLDTAIIVCRLCFVDLVAFDHCSLDIRLENLGGLDFSSLLLKEVLQPQTIIFQCLQVVLMLCDLILILGDLV